MKVSTHWRYFIAVLVLLSLQGCASLYLYDEGREKVSAQALEAFEKANTVALFDRAANDLESHLETERASVQRLITSAQDLQLVAVIEGADVVKLQLQGKSDHASIHPSAQLQRLVNRRLTALVGAEQIDGLLQRKNLDVIKAIQESQASRIVSDRLNLMKLRKTYLNPKMGKGKAENTCKDPVNNPMSVDPPANDNENAKELYQKLLKACRDLGGLILEEHKNRAFGLPFDKLDGEFRLVTTDLIKLEHQQSELAEAKESLEKELNKLKHKYEKALKDVNQHPKAEIFENALKEAANNVTTFLKELEDGQKVIVKVKKLTDGVIDLSTLEKSTGVGVDFMGELVRAKILETNLKALLTQVIDPSKEPKDEEHKRAHTYLLLTVRGIDALARLDDAVYAPTKVPSPNALLISLAYQRYKQEVARVTKDLVTSRLQSKQVEHQAIVEEIYNLWLVSQAAEAMAQKNCGKFAKGLAEFVELCNKKVPLARAMAAKALIAYDQAWSLGLAKGTIAALASSGFRQQYAVEIAGINAKAWFDLLKPALQELVAYGEGGIRHETLTNLIQALGFSFIAAGVN